VGGCAGKAVRDDKEAGMSWWDRLRAWIEEWFPEVADFGTDDEEEL